MIGKTMLRSPRLALVLALLGAMTLPTEVWSRNRGHHSGHGGYRHGGHHRHGGYSVRIGYYRPYGNYPGPYFYGHRYYGYPYAYYAPGPYYYGPPYPAYGGFLGALDLDVKPKGTEVYVNGDYVGITDNFDGFPRHLWIQEGSYEIIFYKDGFVTKVKRYRVRPGAVGKVKFKMQAGLSQLPEELTSYPLEDNQEAGGG